MNQWIHRSIKERNKIYSPWTQINWTLHAIDLAATIYADRFTHAHKQRGANESINTDTRRGPVEQCVSKLRYCIGCKTARPNKHMA